MTQIRVSTFVRCPFSATIDLALRCLSEGTLQVGIHDWMQVTVLAASELVDDPTDSVRLHDALTVRWEAPKRGVLPRFQGLLTVRPHAPGATLRLTGSYEPPLGALGRCFDAAIGRHIAARTARRLLERIRAYVEASRTWEVRSA